MIMRYEQLIVCSFFYFSFLYFFYMFFFMSPTFLKQIHTDKIVYGKIISMNKSPKSRQNLWNTLVIVHDMLLYNLCLLNMYIYKVHQAATLQPQLTRKQFLHILKCHGIHPDDERYIAVHFLCQSHIVNIGYRIAGFERLLNG